MEIAVLYFQGCPAYQPTVKLVSKILKEQEITADIELREVNDESSAETLRFLGSPTVQVNGKDIEKERRGDPSVYGCRIYRAGKDQSGVPPAELIIAALREALARK